jgi:hypothetical protein
MMQHGTGGNRRGTDTHQYWGTASIPTVVRGIMPRFRARATTRFESIAYQRRRKMCQSNMIQLELVKERVEDIKIRKGSDVVAYSSGLTL